jgi:hypothetical protein
MLIKTEALMLSKTKIAKYAVPEFQVMTEDMMLINDLAAKHGWSDINVFGKGDMIGSPKIANHWKLIPADLSESTIPTEAMHRVYIAYKAGVRIKGVIIADDERRPASAPASKMQTHEINQAMEKADQVGSVMLKVLLGLALATVAVVVVSALAAILVALGTALLVIAGIGTALVYDPQLVILIDDGSGGMIWVSLYTWYD